MQNVQDLKQNIFYDLKNSIAILEKVNNVEELIFQQSLIDKLAKQVSFLKLLQENEENYRLNNLEIGENFSKKNIEKDKEEEPVFENQFAINLEEDKENYDQFLSEGERSVLHFVDEERVLENSLPEEDYFEETETEKNVIEEVSKMNWNR